ncbi:MAG: hypothetical protein V4543_02370 [Bacteroidota bacterium]
MQENAANLVGSDLTNEDDQPLNEQGKQNFQENLVNLLSEKQKGAGVFGFLKGIA